MASGAHTISKKKKSKAPKKKAPKKQQKRGNKAKTVIPVVVLVVVLAVALFGGIKIYHALFPSETAVTIAEGEEVVVEIPEGSASSDIASILKDNRLIETCSSFNEEVEARDVASQMKAGTYSFTGGATVDEIIDSLISGPSSYTLLIREGYTAKEVANAVSETCPISYDTFYALTQDAKTYAKDYSFLKSAYNNSLEGYLFPDTYSVAIDATADDIVRMMLENFQTQMAQVDLSYASKKNLDEYDIVRLASIIQKEASGSDDMAGISSVFYNRLHVGMNLGSDVTCYYAVGKDLSETLTSEDLASDSPYNTRNPNVKGLPAGPICCPGLDALNAAAHPSKGSNLYFFYSAKKGKTMFFKDSASFNAAWAKYGE